MKKKLFAGALIAICVSLIAHGTLAYFTAEDTAHNVITSGGVEINVVEWQTVGGSTVPYPTGTAIEIMPGDTVSKMPTVVSTDEAAYIRAAVEITVKDKNGEEMPLSAEEIANIIALDIDTENWQTKDPTDGFYYYKSAISKGAATEPLFTEVKFSAGMKNEFQNCTVEIDVKAKGVQAANNGATVFEAAGWE